MNSRFKPFTLNLHGRLLRVDRPQIMGIVNVTPDSFYEGSRYGDSDAVARRVSEMVESGVDIIDIGACSTRPGSAPVSADEEIRRLRTGLSALRRVAPDLPVSVDTFRAEVARVAVEELGADIINDISGGDLDPDMWPAVARLQVPYIVTHTRGNPAGMQSLTDYGERGVTAEVIQSLSRKIEKLRLAGVADVIADPGFGFAKTVSQNYELLRDIPLLARFIEAPLLVGVSRKSMFTKPLNISPQEALSPTLAANTIAMVGGASFIRVHDVADTVMAREVVTLTCSTTNK